MFYQTIGPRPDAVITATKPTDNEDVTTARNLGGAPGTFSFIQQRAMGVWGTRQDDGVLFCAMRVCARVEGGRTRREGERLAPQRGGRAADAAYLLE